MDKKRILIIDDDAELCEELTELFTEEGYRASCASDSAQCGPLIKNAEFDILILDYKMPGLTGIDILRKMKEDDVKKYIFMVSGNPFAGQLIKEAGLSSQVTEVILKPVNFETLLGKIRSLP